MRTRPPAAALSPLKRLLGIKVCVPIDTVLGASAVWPALAHLGSSGARRGRPPARALRADPEPRRGAGAELAALRLRAGWRAGGPRAAGEARAAAAAARRGPPSRVVRVRVRVTVWCHSMRRLVNLWGGAPLVNLWGKAQHPARALSWALRGEALCMMASAPEPGSRSACPPHCSQPLWRGARRRRSMSCAPRRLEARHPQLKGLGLGGGGSWPFERLLQRVGDVLRALVRPPSPALPRACACRKCTRTQRERPCTTLIPPPACPMRAGQCGAACSAT